MDYFREAEHRLPDYMKKKSMRAFGKTGSLIEALAAIGVFVWIEQRSLSTLSSGDATGTRQPVNGIGFAVRTFENKMLCRPRSAGSHALAADVSKYLAGHEVAAPPSSSAQRHSSSEKWSIRADRISGVISIFS